MKRVAQLLGSLKVAVPLLVAIGGVLAWGTIYETRFGTAAVQQFIYQAWWFQALLGFLAINLAVSAGMRYPWKRSQAPFLCAHLGIILILLGGIIGGRFGVEGQLIIPEGQASSTLELPTKWLVIHPPNSAPPVTVPAAFDAQAWRLEPQVTVPLTVSGRPVTVAVDHYYPDSQVTERIVGGGAEPRLAVRIAVAHEGHEEEQWLLAGDPERFGLRWGDLHVLLVEPQDEPHWARLMGRRAASSAPRGTVSLTLPGQSAPYTFAVPVKIGQPQAIPGTPYQVTLKQYFPDFVIGESGPTTRSDQPNNPAVALTLSGPEGTDPHLLFAFHPEISEMHGWRHTIHAHLRYSHPASERLPPDAVVIVRAPAGGLAAVMTGPAGESQRVAALALGAPYAHPWSGTTFRIVEHEPNARLVQDVTNRSERVRAEAVHVVVRDGAQTAEQWIGFGGRAELPVGEERLVVEFRKAQQELPFAVTLHDFRRVDYPGTHMAQAFEADVELRDPAGGISRRRTISMNNPLKHRGYSLFQASFIEGEVETTVLAVRNDPGVPLVYTGFLIVVVGVIFLFWRRPLAGGGVS
ncbi:MAG: hypothetical protein A3C53_01800 [Omnitrophica WOR_2 bacterium RIFCSPHIGHO2_02_FULL_68_15]|nr:MAG: hypothetical protein A3C53_01800 [Omnitrophica WOR_2 bacterium RIFCSPHIGHO2_02_FULL_68_15]